MAELIDKGKRDPAVRSKAIDLTMYIPKPDTRGKIYAIFEFVRDRIRFVRDINNVETLHTAPRILEQGYGDCDDKVIVLDSLLEAIGIPTASLAVGFQPGRLSHVLGMARLGAGWLPLETTEFVDMGWMPKGVKERIFRANNTRGM